MIDLDRFKEVNDTHGHIAGDEVLKQVAHRLRGAIRYTDVAARLGGDEFAVLLSSVADEAATRRVKDRMRERLCEPMMIGGVEVTVGASIGFELLDENADPNALHAADRAMYREKGRRGGARSAAIA